MCGVKTNEQNGKFAIVKFSKESDAKTALEKLNKNYVDQCQKYNNKNMFRIKRNT